MVTMAAVIPKGLSLQLDAHEITRWLMGMDPTLCYLIIDNVIEMNVRA